MPLVLDAPRSGKTPYFYVRGTHLGVFVNRSTKTGKRALAEKLRKEWERQIECGSFSQPGEPTFADAALGYMNAGGERRFMTPLLTHFGNKPLRMIDQAAIDDAAMALYPNGSAATRNRQVYSPISAVLKRAGVVVDLKRPKGAQGNTVRGWLWPEQAIRLFAEAHRIDAEFAALLVLLCYTGLRLSEALSLTADNVRLADGFAFVSDTKNNEPRAVYLPPVAVAALANLPGDRDRGRAFRFRKNGHLYQLLRASAARADVELPERSAFHIFRHTYMTWMRRYGGLDETGLLNLGTHKDRKSVNRYSHVVVSEEAKKAALLPTPKIRNAG